MTEVYHATQLPLIPLSRICKTCEIDKPLEENFHKQTVRGKLMYRVHCKDCRSKAEKALPPRQEWVEVTSKVCPKCDPPAEKLISEFALDKNSRDGHYYCCKVCQRQWANSEEQKSKRRERERVKNLDPIYRQEQQDWQNAWRDRNIDKLRIQWREKYANDPEYAARMRKNSRKWIKAHPDEMNAHQMKRKAIIQGTAVEDVDYQEILSEYGPWCYICDQPILPHHNLEYDHVIPLIPRTGEPQGTHTKDNIKPTHKSCNARKTNRRLEDLTPFDRRGP